MAGPALAPLTTEDQPVQVFLSYASEDRVLAEEVQLALVGFGHKVFFDKASLPAGGDYHTRIESAVKHSDAFVFLISPNSVGQGSYALTELKFARTKWPHPKGRLLPVRLHNTPWEVIPPYLKSVTVLEPEGNIAAEVVAAVAILCNDIPARDPHIGATAIQDTPIVGEKRDGKDGNSSRTQIWVAVIGMAGILGAALIANWGVSLKVGTTPRVPVEQAGSEGIRGPDTGFSNSPVFNLECPEITMMDYSKRPPESRIVRRCPNEGTNQ